MQDMGKKQGSQSNNKQNQENAESQQGQQQEIPLSERAQKLSQQMDEKIDQFEQVLRSRSNSEIKQVSEQLDRVEREMLLEKVDNQLKTIKETVIRPGDIASTAAAGSAAASAVQTQAPAENQTDTTT